MYETIIIDTADIAYEAYTGDTANITKEFEIKIEPNKYCYVNEYDSTIYNSCYLDIYFPEEDLEYLKPSSSFLHRFRQQDPESS